MLVRVVLLRIPKRVPLAPTPTVLRRTLVLLASTKLDRHAVAKGRRIHKRVPLAATALLTTAVLVFIKPVHSVQATATSILKHATHAVTEDLHTLAQLANSNQEPRATVWFHLMFKRVT